MGTDLINLRVRSLQNNFHSILNEYSDVPIEMQRIILESILINITNKADEIAKQELELYKKKKEEESNNA